MINHLLTLPFVCKVATRDWHPPDHISFAATHYPDEPNPPPERAPFTGTIDIVHPYDSTDARPSTLWPVHCVQGSAGAQLLPELNASAFDLVLDKGMDKRVEMYSAFADIFRNPAKKGVNASEELQPWLKARRITDVFVVGLTGDKCVRWTAGDAVRAGFRVWVVKDAIRCIDDEGWMETCEYFRRNGIEVVDSASDEVRKVAAL